MGTVYVFFADGFEEIEAITIIDVLRRAELDVEMVTVTDEDVVTGAHDIAVACDSFIEEIQCSDAAMLVLPGGMPGAATLGENEVLKGFISDFMEKGKPIAAICAAPMILGKMGYLKGKTVTCYPGFEQSLTGAECTGRQVEKDGNIITGKGPGAAMEFALEIVNTLSGKEKAAELEKALCVKR